MQGLDGARGFPLPRLLLGLLCALFLLAQGVWLAQNQTIVGNDAGSHLVRSLEVYEALRHPSRASLVTIWEVSEHRPPFSYVLTAPFYALFGRSYDVALASNLFWLLLTAGAVYAFAARVGDEWDGLWSAALTLTIPLLFQLSRLYYQETLVACLLWLALLVLLLSEGFTRRWPSILFGLLAGLGLLVKWTLPPFVIGPLFFLFWRHRRDWRAWPPMTRGALLRALTVGAAVAALMAWLVAPLVPSTLWLVGLLLLWTLLAALVALGVSRPPTRLSNLVAAGALALLVASFWYLPRAEFALFFSDLTFGDAGRPEEMAPFSLLSPATWLFYVRALALEQYGLLALLASLLALPALRHERARRGVALLALAFGGAFLIFTLSPFRDHARGLGPIIPALALLTVVGLRRWQPPRVGQVALGLLLLWQAGQFVLLTLPAGEALARPLQAARLLVDGTYQQWPDSGQSDSAYHVAPALLGPLLAEPTEDGRVFLAMLVNEVQLHPNTLRAEFEMLAPGRVRVVALTKEVEEPYRELFHTPFVLYKRGGPTDGSPQALAAIERITADSSGLFAAAFETVWERPTPTGETLVLARRRHALAPASVQERYEPLVAQVAPLLTPQDVALVDGAAQVGPLGAFGWPETPIWATGGSAQGLDARLASELQPGQRLFAILWNQQPESEPWLEERLVRGPDWWFGDTHLVGYVVPTGRAAREERDVGRLGGEVLQRLALEQATLQPGGALVVDLTWEVEADEPAAYRTVLELYAADGTLLAARDLPPDAPWQAGSAATQRTALLLPRELPPHPACLLIARYDPATGQRLLAPTGADHLEVCLE